MDFAKKGQVKKFCVPNAILTFKEYLLDYASEETRLKGNIIIAQYIDFVRKNFSAQSAETVQGYLARIEAGERDLYF